MSRVTALRIVRSVITVQLGRVLQLADAGLGVMARDRRHQQAPPVGGQLLLLTEGGQNAVALHLGTVPQILPLSPAAAEVGVAAQDMNQFVGEDAAQRSAAGSSR